MTVLISGVALVGAFCLVAVACLALVLALFRLDSRRSGRRGRAD
ncbi:MAG TPA: hypothetical protein VEL03_12445 [Streptosporangiaceae bacterium]|nr:hypothetical protein [Streptosporangiaceae bacterium]